MKFSSLIFATAILTGRVSVVTAIQAPAPQMEIRKNEEYSAEQFANSKPAVGEAAPDMELKTLAGEAVKLSSFRGKNVVVIKAGYT